MNLQRGPATNIAFSIHIDIHKEDGKKRNLKYLFKLYHSSKQCSVKHDFQGLTCCLKLGVVTKKWKDNNNDSNDNDDGHDNDDDDNHEKDKDGEEHDGYDNEDDRMTTTMEMIMMMMMMNSIFSLRQELFIDNETNTRNK